MTEYNEIGAEDHTEEQIADLLELSSEEEVVANVRLESALWARVHHLIQGTDHDSVADWIRTAMWTTLGRVRRKNKEHRTFDVELTPREWQRIRLEAIMRMQTGEKDPEFAFSDSVNEHLTSSPQIVVDGQSKGLEDLPDWVNERAGEGASQE